MCPVGRLVHQPTMRNFDTLSEREILALAISLEEEDERVYADFADGLRQEFPASAAVFAGMRHCGRVLSGYKKGVDCGDCGAHRGYRACRRLPHPRYPRSAG